MTVGDEVAFALQGVMHRLERQFPRPRLGVLILGVEPDGDGIELHQISNMSIKDIRQILVAALKDLDSGKYKIQII